MTTAEVLVVDLGLDPARLARCEGVLDPRERARAERFLRPADRARFAASHAALRAVLGRALGITAAAVRVETTAAGRPVLAGQAGDDLEFNLSHSGALALVGLARGTRIGVDVETRRPLPDALRIARGQFAADEASALAALPPEAVEAAFFGLWTRKEAVAKALGAGLSLPLDRFSVTVPPTPPRLLRIAGDARAWTLAELAVGPAACATVAVAAPRATIRTARLPPDWADRL